jgi:hypothetical protein
MNTIALSMIFSLAVIVCEQQTLFAPHFRDWGGLTAANPSDTTNSLIPIAGVNRLVPVAGYDQYDDSRNGGGVVSADRGKDDDYVSKAIAGPQTYGSNPGGRSLMSEQGTKMQDSLEPIRDVDHQDEYDHIRGKEDQTPFTLPYWDWSRTVD